MVRVCDVRKSRGVVVLWHHRCRVVRGFVVDFVVPLCKFDAYVRRQCVSCVCRKMPQKVGMIFIGGLYFVFFAFTLVL